MSRYFRCQKAQKSDRRRLRRCRSSVSARLLQQQGYQQVEGLFMKTLGEEDDGENTVPQQPVWLTRRPCATQAWRELHTVNFAAEYWGRVFELL